MHQDGVLLTFVDTGVPLEYRRQKEIEIIYKLNAQVMQSRFVKYD